MRYFAILVILIFVVTCEVSQTNSWRSRIVSKTQHPISSLLGSCPTDLNVLIIDGKRFERVRGAKQFYLPVRGTNAIFFVIDEPNYSVTYHFFDMTTDTDIAIPSKSSTFGRTIGLPGCNESVCVTNDCRVLLQNVEAGGGSVSPELATLDRMKSSWVLDLRARKVISQKTLYFDKSGKLLRDYDETLGPSE